MQNEDSLVAKTFKAKYYANSNFMKAQLGLNPSDREAYKRVSKCWRKD